MIFFFFFSFAYSPYPNRGLTPQGLTSQMPVGQMPVGGATVSGPEHKGRPPWMCGQHNVRASAKDNTGQNAHPIPGQKLKFLTPPGIEPGPLGWKARTLPTMAQLRIKWFHSYIQYTVKVKVSHYRPWKPTGDVDARIHIFIATAVGRGRVASPTLGRLYTWGNSPVLTL